MTRRTSLAVTAAIMGALASAQRSHPIAEGDTEFDKFKREFEQRQRFFEDVPQPTHGYGYQLAKKPKPNNRKKMAKASKRKNRRG